MRLAFVLFVLALAAPTRAQTECDVSIVGSLASSITSAVIPVPPPPRIPAERCMSVGPPSLELGSPIVGLFAGSCPVVAIAYRWTTMLSETCGNDVHFEPAIVTGVIVVRRNAGRWERVATGTHPMTSLDALGASDVDADGVADLTLGASELAVEGRRVVLRDP